MNGPLKIEKGEKVQISKLLQGQVSDKIPNLKSECIEGSKERQNSSDFDIGGVDLPKQDAIAKDFSTKMKRNGLMKSENVI